MLAMLGSVFPFTAFLLFMRLLKVLCLSSVHRKDDLFSDRTYGRVVMSTGCAVMACTLRLPEFSVSCANDILLIPNRMLRLILYFRVIIFNARESVGGALPVSSRIPLTT